MAGLPVPAEDHVFLVVLENHSFSQVIGSSSMPFLNSLATQHSLAAGYSPAPARPGRHTLRAFPRRATPAEM